MIEVNEQILLERAEKVVEAAGRYKQHAFAMEIFKNKSRAFLAKAKMEIRKTVVKISESELETRALASPFWQDYIQIEMNDLEKAGVLKFELEAAQVRYEAMRSALSSRKAEVRSFG